MYQGSSGHKNLKKGAPGDLSPPGPPKGSKVAIPIRGNVPGELRSPKSEKGAPAEIALTRTPKRKKSNQLYKGESTQRIHATKA
jgi:hypothetical protein